MLFVKKCKNVVKNDLNFENGSHETASQYIMLQDFAFKQVLEFALTSSSCYKIKKQGVILLNYCRSLKTTPQDGKTQFHRKNGHNGIFSVMNIQVTNLY